MVVVAGVLMVGGLVLVLVGWRGRNDHLTLNRWIGIRTATTMQSDATWEAAQRAGGMWIITGGIVMIVTGVAMLFVDDDDAAATVALVGTFVMLSAVLAGGWLGQRAAKRVTGS